MFINDQGEAYACGYNYRGQLGLGNTNSENIPRLVKGLEGRYVLNISCSYYHTVLSCFDSSVFSFGRNDFGQLGQGDFTDRKIPRIIDSLRGLTIKSLACGQYHTCMATDQGDILTCGKNDYGQLGIDNSECQKILINVFNQYDDNEGEEGHHINNDFDMRKGTVIDVRCGYYHTLILCKNSKSTSTTSSSTIKNNNSTSCPLNSGDTSGDDIHVLGWGRNGMC